mmetsp:Transcript_26740/g.64800  ORF Transcript_26740/g.64800 Transcript_26740/m.64800 type:complete len:206 (-) Transcript_26740:483-1100(-)
MRGRRHLDREPQGRDPSDRGEGQAPERDLQDDGRLGREQQLPVHPGRGERPPGLRLVGPRLGPPPAGRPGDRAARGPGRVVVRGRGPRQHQGAPVLLGLERGPEDQLRDEGAVLRARGRQQAEHAGLGEVGRVPAVALGRRRLRADHRLDLEDVVQHGGEHGGEDHDRVRPRGDGHGGGAGRGRALEDPVPLGGEERDGVREVPR